MATFTQPRGAPPGDRRDCESSGTERCHAPLLLWSSERKSEQGRDERSPVPCGLPIAFRPYVGEARRSGGVLLAASRPCPCPGPQVSCVPGGIHCARHRNRPVVFDGGDASAGCRTDLAFGSRLSRCETGPSGMAATGTVTWAARRSASQGRADSTGDSKCPSGRQSLAHQTSTSRVTGPLPGR